MSQSVDTTVQAVRKGEGYLGDQSLKCYKLSHSLQRLIKEAVTLSHSLHSCLH